jgi:two-component system, cell cycle sensor histidine kinase PleC
MWSDATRLLREHLATGGAMFWIVANAVVAAGYFGMGWIVSGYFSAYGLFPAPIWLPAAVATVAALAGGWRLFAGIFAGSFLVNAVLFAPPLHVTTIISVTNALGPVAGAMILRRLRPAAAGIFTSFGGVVRFLLCTMMLSPAVSAGGGALALAIGHPLDWQRNYSIWVSWWLCDSGGALFLAPALLLWLGLEYKGDAERAGEPVDRRHLLVWAGIAAFTLLLFLTPAMHANDLRQILPFLLVVPLSWVALRMSLRSAYTLVSLVAIAAAAGTVAGFGPFHDPTVANPLQMVGALVVLLAMDVLTTVALSVELHEAQNASRVKSMFLATTSHELRSPLNAILGFSSLLDEGIGAAATGKHAEYARIIHTAGEHLLALINSLLDLSKIEAGRFALDEEQVPLAEAVEEAAVLLSPLAAGKGVALGWQVPAEIAAVVADRQAFNRILVNLISNAVKFTPSGGSVEVSAGLGPQGELLLRVRDTGVGIPAEALERVFAPFERLHRGSGQPEGTGLGLSITRGLAELHGGTVTLSGNERQGTTASVTLPAARVVLSAENFAEAAD